MPHVPRIASRPSNQSEGQAAELIEWLRTEEPHRSCKASSTLSSTTNVRAQEMVKEDWREPGIYDLDWPSKPSPWLWQHGELIELESEEIYHFLQEARGKAASGRLDSDISATIST
jgi:hypothetical protein